MKRILILVVALISFSAINAQSSVIKANPLGLAVGVANACLLYTSPSPRDAHESRMPSSA